MIDEVRRGARSYFEDASPAHDWQHVQRVEALAETLLERHPGSADGEVLRLAVLLHDIGREKEDRGGIDDHSAWGATEAERLLEDVGASAATVERVSHCVRSHRFSTGPEPETLEAKLLSDADNLDALGAVGIARVFAYGGESGSPIHGPSVLPGETDPTDADDVSQYAHVHEKILQLADRMYTDVGGELADDRTQFVQEYVRQFDAEVAGDR
ncbi:HD domain-containing protein [Natronobacterium gregoryi]|uniref:Domain HDIG-containing protein n=2 Tax=Natronobacterium gregoryi TaxID=44930 RepID=L0AHU1_NATGS|nr:HD domain-containing protein [Natronobacterium gregoryi]AFZ72727.1 putative domain HDIG-containing protein [Natronobacterium gregoryi SP2]ELY69218.1 metal dependent phosphohydrolase [Natronobacterium gregoryi SP2]PLK18449.1 HD domain-containing protein [Natronobacterium gregoryi SP2]SFJ70889.1 uncharacterized protein SAMN05443661_16210 [Natronobacterium gregoryi]